LSSRNRFVSAHARAAARRPKVPRRLPASTGSGCRIGSVQSTAPQYLAPSCARFDEDIGTHQLYGNPRRRHLRRPTQHEPGSRQREGSPVRIGVDISAYTLDPSTSRVTSDLAMVCGQNPNVRIPRIHTVRRDLGSLDQIRIMSQRRRVLALPQIDSRPPSPFFLSALICVYLRPMPFKSSSARNPETPPFSLSTNSH